MAAQIGIWSGGAATGFPGTSFVSVPANTFGTTQDRNDNSAYTWNASTAALSLPTSNLASAYLLIARVKLRITHNNRAVGVLRFNKISGTTGTFTRTTGSGYARNNANNDIFITCAAIVINPSNDWDIRLQWKRDAGSGTPAGSIISTQIQVAELKNITSAAAYLGTATDLLGGTTPNVVTLNANLTQSGNISRSGNVVTLSGLNRKYLVITSQYYEGRGGRTQRWVGYNLDGVQVTDGQYCIYSRDTSNDMMGGYIFDIVEVGASSRTLELTCYRGDGVLDNEGGADVDGSTPTSAENGLIVLELPDHAEVFRSTDTTGAQNIENGFTPIDINGARSFDFNDSSSFTKASDSAVNIEKNMDLFVIGNIGAAYNNVSSGTRHQKESRLTVNGTADPDIFHGNYGRGNQGSADTFGNSFHPLGIKAVSSGDDVGFEIIDAGDNGPVSTQPNWVSFSGINLDSLDTPIVSQRRIFIT